MITAGPWKYDPETERIHGDRFTLVAWCKPHATDPKSTHDNGTLIACAPELLKALEEANDCVKMNGFPDGNPRFNELIARAKGKSA